MNQIHIVGAGVSGMALATLLPTDWEVHIYEHNDGVRTAPTIFSIFPGGQKALAAMGLLGALNDRSVAVDSARIYDSQGRTLTTMGKMGAKLIPRPELLRLLRGQLPENVQFHRRAVTSPAHLANGSDAPLIVGADGVHSVVRRTFWPARSSARRLGVTAIRGVIDEVSPKRMVQEIWRADGPFGFTPRPEGGVNWYATVPRQYFNSADEAIQFLRNRWSKDPGPPGVILQHATADKTLVNDLWQSGWPGQLVRSPSVLIGDAAHAMSPSLGRGANEALIDSLALGTALRTKPISQALGAYQCKRLVAPQLVKRASHISLRLATTRLDGLRDGLIRLGAGR